MSSDISFKCLQSHCKNLAAVMRVQAVSASRSVVRRHDTRNNLFLRVSLPACSRGRTEVSLCAAAVSGRDSDRTQIRVKTEEWTEHVRKRCRCETLVATETPKHGQKHGGCQRSDITTGPTAVTESRRGKREERCSKPTHRQQHQQQHQQQLLWWRTASS